MFTAHHARQDFLNVIRQHARGGVTQALASGRRDVVGAAPFVHLLLAPFFARVVLVQPAEVAVVALVERLVLEHRDLGLAQFLQHQIERALRADERRGEGDVELDALAFKLAAGLARFGDAFVGQVDIAPAGEQVLQVPVALAVTHEDEKAVSHFAEVSLFNFCAILPAMTKQIRPATTKMTDVIDDATSVELNWKAPTKAAMPTPTRANARAFFAAIC